MSGRVALDRNMLKAHARRFKNCAVTFLDTNETVLDTNETFANTKR